MEKHLYIIGNGFDLHHDIKSSYRNFRNWLYENNSSVILDIEEAYGYCDEDWWSDFENQLGSLDILEYASNIANENTPDLTSDHCDRMWNDAQIEVEQNLDGLYRDLRNCFRDWILQLNPPREDKMIELIRENSCFLTFNYTKTLEKLYNIPSIQILHIHGCIDDNEEFVLGHGIDVDELRNMLLVNDPVPPCENDLEEYEQWKMEMEQEHPFHQQLAEDAAIHGVASQKKPVEKLLQQYKYFFDSLNEVTHVHIYGMSFSEVDAPYLNKVANMAQNAKWEISDYNSKCQIQINNFIALHNISDYSVIELDSLVANHQ